MSTTHDTRRESYEEIQAKAPKRWELIYSYLLRHGPSTAEEIRNGLGYRDMNAVRPRVNEMAKRGLVRAVGKRPGSAGRNTAVWEVIQDADLAGEGGQPGAQ